MHIWVPIAANVVLGVLLVALFLSRRTVDDARLGDGDAALRLYRAQFPDASGAATVTADERGALIALAEGSACGILQRRGRRWMAREIGADDLRSVSLTGPDTLCLALADFGWPRAQFRIADPGARSAWLTRLESLAARGAQRHAPVSTHA